APAAPSVYYNGQPDFVLVAGTNAYWATNSTGEYAVYRYGSRYYLVSNQYWYDSPSYDGPFVVVRERSVPVPVFAAVDYRARYGDSGLRGDRYRYGGYEGYGNRTDRIVVRFEHGNHADFRRLSGTNVYVCNNPEGSYDLYRYQGEYYIRDEGAW